MARRPVSAIASKPKLGPLIPIESECRTAMSAGPRAALPSSAPRYFGVRMVLMDTAIMTTPVMHQ